MSLKGKTIVITGSSSGIGAKTAQDAIDAGANVIGIDVRPSSLPLATSITADLCDLDSLRAAAAEVPQGVDALLNVAGVSSVLGMARTLTINFFGLRALTEALLPALRDGASVVSVASISGSGWRNNTKQVNALVATPGMPDVDALAKEHAIDANTCYDLSKQLVIVWTMKSALENLNRGIRFNAVSPGPVETSILQEFRDTLGPALVQSNIDDVKRAGEPADIAPVLLYLASDASRWINGANVPIDGGLDAVYLQRAGVI